MSVPPLEGNAMVRLGDVLDACEAAAGRRMLQSLFDAVWREVRSAEAEHAATKDRTPEDEILQSGYMSGLYFLIDELESRMEALEKR